jgi:hypothetical protein
LKVLAWQRRDLLQKLEDTGIILVCYSAIILDMNT